MLSRVVVPSAKVMLSPSGGDGDTVAVNVIEVSNGKELPLLVRVVVVAPTTWAIESPLAA
jgi:hypothetical protein